MTPRSGFTLIELMVAMAAGLVLLTAASALLRQSRTAYDDMDRLGQLHDNARASLQHLALALAHAGHQSPDRGHALVPLPAVRSRRQDGNAGDRLILTLRADHGRYLRNCGGGGKDIALDADLRSEYFTSATPTPALSCTQRTGARGTSTNALTPDVERLSLDYGVDSDGDGHADRWLDTAAMPGPHDPLWTQVRLVRVELVMRDRAAPVSFHTTAWLRNAGAARLPKPAMP